MRRGNLILSVLLSFFAILAFSSVMAESCSDVVKMGFEKWGQVNDYVCRMEAYNKKGSEEDFKVYEYKYMKPGYVYMFIVEGKSKGAKVFYDPTTNRVKGCKKILFYICKTFDPANPKVTSIRGAKVPESTMGYILEQVKGFIESGIACSVQDAESAKVLVLKSDNPFTEGDVDEMRVYMDKDLGLPVKWERYSKGELVNRVILKDVQLNVGLKKEDFKP